MAGNSNQPAGVVAGPYSGSRGGSNAPDMPRPPAVAGGLERCGANEGQGAATSIAIASDDWAAPPDVPYTAEPRKLSSVRTRRPLSVVPWSPLSTAVMSRNA